MIGISLVIHLFIFMYIAGVYQSHALSYIELTLQNISKPFTRSIPRPRYRPKTPQLQEVKKLMVTRQLMPCLKHMKLEPTEKELPDSLMEGVSIPDIPETSNLRIADWNPGGSEEFVTTNDYFEMVRLKIESCKKYPDAARARHLEGRVKIQFVITTNGQILSLKVVKHARHGILNRAALDAVKNAVPFPRPPPSLFKEPLHIEITILFELT